MTGTTPPPRQTDSGKTENVSPTEQDSETLWRTAKAHLTKADKATDKATQHQVAAGLTLQTLKARHQGSWAEWETLVKAQLGIGTGRASELMQIADGRKTVEQVRARSNESSGIAHKKSRQSSSLISEETDTKAPASCDTADHLTPWAAHGQPAPGDDGEGVTLLLAEPDPIERIRELEIKVEELEAEVTNLRQQLAAFKSPVLCEFVENDGGREAAGYEEPSGDCVARAIAIATCKPYAEVFEALKAKYASYVKRLRHDHYERRRRVESVSNGCIEQVYGPYLKSLGWQYTRIRERLCLRAKAFPSGRLIVHVNRHFVALIDDVIHDTYDSGGSGRRPVIGYWSQVAAPPLQPDHSDEESIDRPRFWSGEDDVVACN